MPQRDGLRARGRAQQFLLPYRGLLRCCGVLLRACFRLLHRCFQAVALCCAWTVAQIVAEGLAQQSFREGLVVVATGVITVVGRSSVSARTEGERADTYFIRVIDPSP